MTMTFQMGLTQQVLRSTMRPMPERPDDVLTMAEVVERFGVTFTERRRNGAVAQ